MSKSIVGKIKLNSYADIIGGDDLAVTEVPLTDLHDFKDHPFRVQDDAYMDQLVESIKLNGVLTAGTVRPRPEGGYEIISGHRRRRACELAGLETMPVLIKALDDDAAMIDMVDANLQREEILPSEKARAYAMKYEAMKHQGSKSGGLTLEELGVDAGESGKTVQRYIWLARLSEDLLQMVDDRKISFVCGVDLSFLKDKEQAWVYDCVKERTCAVNAGQSAKLKEYSAKKELSAAMVGLILSEDKPKPRRFMMRAEKLNSYFDEEATNEEIEETICRLLDRWKANGGKE